MHSVLPCVSEFGVIKKTKRKINTVEMFMECIEMIATKFETDAVTGYPGGGGTPYTEV